VKHIDQQTARATVYALLDVMDGIRDHDIEAMTGLPPARCKEIAHLHSGLLAAYGGEWLTRK